MTAIRKLADPQQDRAGNEQRHPRATHPAIPHLATKDFAKRVVVIHDQRDSREGCLNPISE